MTVEGKAGVIPRDRYAEVLVVVVVIAALLVAWGVKAGAESRAVHFQDRGFQASYGHNWIREKTVPPEVLRIVDPGAGARFRTTIAVRKLEDAGTYRDVAKSLNQARLQEKELYQFLGERDIQLRGRDAYRNEFAYVYVSPDLLNPSVPIVLHGVDYILRHGSTTYVITWLADESVYGEAMVELERFLDTVTPG
jgi:hypothetical protein